MQIPEANVKRYVKQEVKETFNVINVEPIIEKLATTLHDTHSDYFFKQVANSLPESVIWSNLEIALTKHKPAAYFSTVCKAMMSKNERG
jgi:hypothetical protein